MTNQTEVVSDIDSAVEPYKSDNAKLIKENNEMHMALIKQKEEADTTIRGRCGLFSYKIVTQTVLSF